MFIVKIIYKLMGDINSNKIEAKAISSIRYIVDDIPNFEHSFEEKDKKISLDGEILVYNSNDTTKKKNYLYSINVQIKGRTNSSRDGKVSKSFQMDVDDLGVMLAKDGAILFVVDFWKNRGTILYAELLPHDLRTIIKNAKENGNKSKSVKLKELKRGKESRKMAEICNVFHENQKMQKRAPEVAFDNQKADEVVEYRFYTGGDNLLEEIEERLSEEKYYYGVDKNGNVLQVLKRKVDNIVATGTKIYISDKSSKYKYEADIKASKGEKLLVFGDAFSVDLANHSFNYTVSGCLNKRIDSLEFLNLLIDEHALSINDVIVPLEKNKDGKTASEELKLMKRLSDALIALGVKKSPNLDLWSRENIEEIIAILESIPESRHVSCSLGGNKYGTFIFYDIRLALLYVADSSGGGKFVHINRMINGVNKLTTTASNGHQSDNPLFALKSGIYLSDNIDLSLVKKLIVESEFKGEDFDLANGQVIELIKAFDGSGNDIFLDYAKEILDRSIAENEVGENTVIINLLQIKKRTKGLDVDDFIMLSKIIEETSDSYIKICSYILLGKISEAERLLDGLANNESKKYFMSQPIFHLMKQHTNAS